MISTGKYINLRLRNRNSMRCKYLWQTAHCRHTNSQKGHVKNKDIILRKYYLARVNTRLFITLKFHINIALVDSLESKHLCSKYAQTNFFSIYTV